MKPGSGTSGTGRTLGGVNGRSTSSSGREMRVGGGSTCVVSRTRREAADGVGCDGVAGLAGAGAGGRRGGGSSPGGPSTDSCDGGCGVVAIGVVTGPRASRLRSTLERSGATALAPVTDAGSGGGTLAVLGRRAAGGGDAGAGSGIGS